MKILISSHLFHPSIGGVESVGRMLAEEFVKLGHGVRIVTQTPASGHPEFPFEIMRRPSALELCRAVRWCDLFFHNNISLQTAWPLLFIRRPWLVAHHTWIARPDGRKGWRDYLKRFLLRFASSISIGQAIADSLPVPSVIIPDPYRDDVFCEIPSVARTKELIFVGRLVSDKGADLLIEAMALLKQRGMRPELTIAGDGPELKKLQQLTHQVKVRDQVSFVGVKTGCELVEMFNRHQILVVPSRWQEPFGIVALEGIACGCVVVGSSGGGLKDAIGPCGVTVAQDDVPALVEALEDLLRHPEQLLKYRLNAASHLATHRAATVAKDYLKVMEAVLGDRSKWRPRSSAEPAARLQKAET